MERKDRITFMGKPRTLVGPEIKAGDKAPNFILMDNGFNEVTLRDFQDKVKLISVALSVDTSVCDQQVRRFNEQAANLGRDVVVLNVTMDLPFTLKRFCGAAGIDRVMTLSDYRHTSFGENYGVLIKDLRLLARAVFVVDVYNNVTYSEIMSEAGSSVNYDNALKAVSDLLSRGKAA